MSRVAMAGWGGLVLLAGAAAGGALWVESQLRRPFLRSGDPVLVMVRRGMSGAEIARLLEREGVIESAWLFHAGRIRRDRPVLQAGEYRFAEPAPLLDVIDRMARGDIYYHELVVPEGANRFEIAEAVEELGIVTAEEFREASADPAAIQDLAPRAASLEGYLFPAVYPLRRGMTSRQICRQMTSRFRQAWIAAGGKGPVHEIIALASLVEKETAVEDEKPLVASVYVNRLREGMRLECDPTVIYAALLENRWRGKIYKSDLASEHPYNTYRHKGLPPGPIGNPGIGAIRAALSPSETEWMYFVAETDGGRHVFSKSYRSHLRAVAAYRRQSDRLP